MVGASPSHATDLILQTLVVCSLVPHSLRSTPTQPWASNRGTYSAIEVLTKVLVFESKRACILHLYACGLQVGGLGLTITAADRVIIVDPNWNPATDNQVRTSPHLFLDAAACDI